MPTKVKLSDLNYESYERITHMYDLNKYLSKTSSSVLTIQGANKGLNSSYFAFRSKHDQDVYVRLKGMNRDSDLKVYTAQEFFQEGAHPFVTSTRAGLKQENLFFQARRGKEYILSVRNLTKPLAEDVSKFTLEFLRYKHGNNPRINVPNDEFFDQQWYLFNGSFQESATAKLSVLNSDTYAAEAWLYGTSAKGIPVAVIDNGIDYAHPDLKNNLWVNRQELEGLPDHDDDGNGYDDDIHGWNFSAKNDVAGNAEFCLAPRLCSHGTHVAGIIGAEGNNRIGVAGVAWQAELMNLVYDPNQIDRKIPEAVRYAVDNGAKVINISLGDNIKISPESYTKKGFNKAVRKAYLRAEDAFRYAADNDVLVVVSAGNEASRQQGDLYYWDGVGNNDRFFAGWASLGHKLDNIISVGSVGANGRIAPYSNYGKKTVDILAPGGTLEVEYDFDQELDVTRVYDLMRFGIMSTFPVSDPNPYGRMLGTSMAAPIVSGAAALVWAAMPDLSAPEVKQILLESATKNPLNQPFVDEGRQLDLFAAMQQVASLQVGDVIS